jgi:uncharacterized membrane-anchored protein
VLAMLFAWYRSTGRIQFENITAKKDEIFYWVTILVSNTLERRSATLWRTTRGWALNAARSYLLG